MTIKEAAISLIEFNKVLSHLPEGRLKDNLRSHVDEMTHSLISERVKINRLNADKRLGDSPVFGKKIL